MNKSIKKILLLVGVVAILSVAGLAAFFSTLDANEYKQEIAKLIRIKTGREVFFEGHIGFTFFPDITLDLGPMAIGNAPGFPSPEMLRVKSAKASLLLGPLLSGKMAFGKIELDGLTLRLTKNSRGVVNWGDLTASTDKSSLLDASGKNGSPSASGEKVAQSSGTKIVQVASDDEADKNTDEEDGVSQIEMSVQGVEISNASLVYEDLQKDSATTVHNLNLTLGHIGGTESIPFSLGFNFQQSHSGLDITPTLSGTLRLSSAEGESGAADMLTADTLTVENLQFSALDVRGTGHFKADLRGDSAFSGSMHLQEVSVRTLLDNLGVALPDMKNPQALERASADVRFHGTANSAELDELTVKLDDTALTAWAKVNNFSRPVIVLKAQVDDLDVARYLPAQALVAQGGESWTGGASATNAEGSDVAGSSSAFAQLEKALADVTLDAEFDLRRFRCLGTTGSAQVQMGAHDGTVLLGGGLRLATGAARELLGSLGVSLPATADPNVLGEASVDLAFRGDSRSVELSRMTLQLDDTTLTAKGKVDDLSHPEIILQAEVDAINVDRYLPGAGAEIGAGTATGARAAMPNPAKSVSDDSKAAKAKTASGAKAVAVRESYGQDAKVSGAGTKAGQGLGETVQTAWKQLESALSGTTLDAGLAVRRFQFRGASGSASARVDSREGAVAFGGDVQLTTGSARQFLKRLGVEPPRTADPKVLGKTSVDLAFQSTPRSATLERLTLRMDDTTLSATGKVVDYARPVVTLRAQVDAVDADRYLPPASAAKDDRSASSGEKNASQGGSESGAESSAKQPDLAALRGLDVDALLDVGSLKINRLKASNIHLGVRVDDGLVTANPVALDLYKGHYAGQASLDARSASPAWTVKGDLKGMQVRPVLLAVLQKDLLSGTATVDHNLSGRGLTPDEMKKSVDGNLSFTLANGEVIGLDVSKIIQEKLGQKDRGGKAKKQQNFKFSKVSGSARLDGGHIDNKDLVVDSSLVKVTGAGWADLPKNTADYAAIITVVGSLSGLEGELLSLVRGIPLPVHITGSLDEPAYSVDMKSLPKTVLSDVAEEGLVGLANALLGDDDQDLEEDSDEYDTDGSWLDDGSDDYDSDEYGEGDSGEYGEDEYDDPEYSDTDEYGSDEYDDGDSDDSDIVGNLLDSVL